MVMTVMDWVQKRIISGKSIPGRACYFETYLPDYAAMFDKLPISAFLSSPEIPDPDMTLHNLQFWNCMDYGVVAVQKQFIGSMHYEVYTRDFGTQTGTYICTLDNYHQDVDAVDYSTSEHQRNISLITFLNWIMDSFVCILITE